jgi:hypothetical protein
VVSASRRPLEARVALTPELRIGWELFRWQEWWILAAIFFVPERKAEGWWLWLRGSERLGSGWRSRGPSTAPLSVRLRLAQGLRSG